MNARIRTYLVVFLLFFGYKSIAQENVLGNVNMTNSIDHIELNMGNLKSTTLTTVDLTSKALVGSMYINESFMPGTISSQENTYSFRYNAYQDEMEVKFGEKKYFMPLSSYYSITFVGTNKTYEVLDFEDLATAKKGFFVTLHKGNHMSLYKKERVKFYPEVPAKLGFTRYEPPKLQRTKDSFYVRLAGTSVVLVPQKKKEAIKLFKKQASLMSSYIKKQKLNFKNEQDLIQMVGYYNSLF
jgi:hypothetical protein